MSFLPSFPGATSLMDILAAHPRRSGLLLKLCADIMAGNSAFSAAERELFFAFGSAVNACSFCADSHLAVANSYGVDNALLEHLLADIDSAPIEEDLKPVFVFIRKLTETPARMSERDAEAVLAAGWDEQALYDIINITALLNFFNRLADGSGVEVDAAQARERAAREIPALGYGAWAEMLMAEAEAPSKDNADKK